MNYSGIKSIAVNALFLSSAKVITSLARAVYAIALAKYLGPELYGLFNYGLSWYILFVPLGTLGLGAVLIKEIGQNRNKAVELVGLTLPIRTLSTFLVAIVSFLLAWLLETDPLVRNLIFIFTIALFGRSFSLWANSIFTAYESSGFVLAQESVFRILEVIIGIFLLVMGYGVLELALLHGLSWLLQGFSGMFLIRRYLLNAVMIWNKKAQIDLIKKGLPFVVSTFALGWMLQGSIIMYQKIGDATINLGQLALALQGFFIIGAVISELGQAAIPVLARSIARDDGKSNIFLDIILRLGTLMAGVIGVFSIILSHWVVDRLFGKEYALTAELLPWVLIMVVFYFWSNVLRSLLVARGCYKEIMIINLVSSLIFTVVLFPLTHLFEYWGVILSLAIGLMISSFGLLLELKKYYKLNLIKRGAGFFLSTGAVCLITYQSYGINSSLALLLGLLSLFLFSFAVGTLRVDEINKFISFWRKN